MVATDANLRYDAVHALACLMMWQVPGKLTPLRLVPAAAAVLADAAAPANDVAADVAAAPAAPAKAQRAAFAAPS